MKNLFYRLLIYLDSANETDTNYNIAWYMAHHISEVAHMGISKLASECFVSPATISRFCRTLGYENYAHLKQECAWFSSTTRKFNNLINVPLDMMKENPKESTAYYSQQICTSLSQLSSYLDWNVIDEVLKLIHDSDNVAFFGTQFSHSVALHFQTDLLMLEKFTMAYMEQTSQLQCAKELDENSVAIILTVSGHIFNGSQKMISYIKKSNAKVVVITNDKSFDFGFEPNYIIEIGDSKYKKTGKHNLLTTMELMSLRYYSIYYPDVKDNIIE